LPPVPPEDPEEPDVPEPVLPLVPGVPLPVLPPVGAPLVPEDVLGALGTTVPPLLAELEELELLVLVPEEVMGWPHSLKP
jgi:hypothetical protein